MSKGLIIFDGIRFPHHVVDHAISWAKNNGASLKALFLFGREYEEGYLFPNDLDEAQDVTDKEDAEKDDMRLINSHIRLLEGAAGSVKFESEILVDPELDEVLLRASDAQAVFIDANHEETGLMPLTKFDYEDLLKQLPSVERISSSPDR